MTILASQENFVAQIGAEFSRSTALSYGQAMKLFNVYLNEVGINPASAVSNLNADLFIEFVLWALRYRYNGEKHFSKSSLKLRCVGVQKYMDYLIMLGKIELTRQQELRLKMARKHVAKRIETKVPRTPKPGDMQKILAAARASNDKSPIRERNIAIVLMLAKSGARRAELCSLSRRDFDMEDRTAVVIGKGNQRGILRFNEEARDALQVYWDAAGISQANDPAFCRHDKSCKWHERMGTYTLYVTVKNLARAAGVDPLHFTPHSCRHDFAIEGLKESGGNLILVQNLLRHKDVHSTQIYAEIREADVDAMYRKMFDSGSVREA